MANEDLHKPTLPERPAGPAALRYAPELLNAYLLRVARPLSLYLRDGELSVEESVSGELAAYVPPCRPEDLGDADFCREHGLRYPYIAGAMAHGIGSVEIVEQMGRAGMLAFFGAAGLEPEEVERAIDRISNGIGERPWGCNLIYSPFEPALESALADLYIRRGVHLVSAAAYLDLSLPLVRYRVHGITADSAGNVVAPNKVIGKVSRIEVARKFLAPPPAELLSELIRRGEITESQARMAANLPLAQDLTVEADSGGHTDNRPALALLPTMLALRDNAQAAHGYKTAPRIGAAGGIGTPQAAAALFSMGAAYVLTGTINQACREAGTSDLVKQMLAEAEQADVIMAPAADMFEMGVKLQVLKRGTLFAMRAQKLYDLYREHDSLEQIPASERAALEKSIFRSSLGEIWEETKAFWQSRDPRQVERAGKDAKHRMALVFRWYLGQSSAWAKSGDPSRKIDYQIWCGPAIGAFNEWARGSHFEAWQNRRVAALALNILYGACVLLRVHFLRSQGVALSGACPSLAPREPSEIEEYLK